MNFPEEGPGTPPDPTPPPVDPRTGINKVLIEYMYYCTYMHISFV